MEQLLALVLAAALVAVPYPTVEDGRAELGPGEARTWDLDLSTGAHVTYIIRSAGGPADVTLAGADGVLIDDREVPSIYRSQRLGPGEYDLTVTNNASGPIEVRYQIYVDFEVVAGLTAKNLLVLSLAAALVIVVTAVRLLRRR